MSLYKFLFPIIIFVNLASAFMQAQSNGQYLTIVRDGDIIAFDANSGIETILVADANPERNSVAWSPDGLALVFQTGSEISVWGARSGDIFQIEIASNNMASASVNGYFWSPDGRWIAYRLYYVDMELEEEDYQFFMVEVAPESQPRLIADIFPTSIQWAPDSSRIMYGGTGGYFRFDATTGTNEPLNVPAYEYPSWSPDGAQFTVHTECPCIGENAELNLYTVETGDAQSVAEGYQIMAQSFSPDGQWIGYEWDSRFWGERISVVNVDTGQDIEVAAAEFGDLSLWGWSPDSAMVAYTVPSRRSGAYEEALHVVNIETAEDRMITDDQRYHIGWSSDSQWIAYLVDNDVVVIDDLVNDRALQITDFDYVIGWRP